MDNKFFVGLVSSTDAVTYATVVQTFGSTHKSPMLGIPLAGVFATTLGFRESAQYSVGQSVFCYAYSFDKCYILGAIPDHDVADLQSPTRAALKTADGTFDKQNTEGYNQLATKMLTFNQGRPTDVVEGEYVVSNEFGVLLGLFQSLATLKASELAQIQCYVLDDLVRIISHNYEHLHALGEFKIFHDGKALMAEFGATHDPREAMGVAQVDSAKSESKFTEDAPPSEKGTDETDFYKIDGDERIKAIERLKGFLGSVGDMIHLFLTKPDPGAVRALSGEISGKFDTGMADFQVGLDGRINIRTVTGASIEKTNWIMVPHRVRTPEDPKGDATEDITFEEKDPFEFDNSKKFRDNPTLYFLQMRDCNAYLQDFYNYKNFLQYKKDFKLSKGPNNDETKLEDIDKVHPLQKVNLKDYKLRRSGLYLMDNGGVMIKDAWGSAIVLEGGDIYIQAAKDEIHQPLRNYITKAGKFINISARKDVDISSTDEGFRVKTKKVQHLYSDEEGIVLQSNSDKDSEPTPEDKAYTGFGGILLKSVQGVYTYGKKIFDRADERALYKAGSLMLEASDKTLNLKAATMLGIKSDETVMITADETINIVSQATVNVFGSASANLAGASTNIGNKGSIIGMTPHPGSLPAIMDGVIPVGDIVGAFSGIGNDNYQEQFSPFDQDDKFTKIKFRFLASSDYNLSEQEDHIPMTIAQQDDNSFNFLKLEAWEEKEINNTLPFPGKDKFSTYYSTCDLNNLQKIGNDIFSKDSESLKNSGTKITDKDLKQYKVIK
jgi:hypothetical protein